MVKLLGYDYEILYHPRHDNLTADVLSKVSRSLILNALSLPQVSLWEDIKQASTRHPYMEQIIQQAQNNPGKTYTCHDGLVFFKTRVVVPLNTVVIGQLLQVFHDRKIGGNLGILGTFKHLS